MKQMKKLFIVLLAMMVLVSGCNFGKPNNSTQPPIIDDNTDDNQDETEDDKQNESQDETENGDEDDVNGEEDDDTEDEVVIMYVTGNGVNVRKGPGTSYDVIAQLNKNDEVIIDGEAVDGWQKIIYNGSEAYISAKYLSAEKEEESISNNENPNQVPEITEVPDLEIYEPEGESTGILIVIDAGHQGVGNKDKEPDGPGSSNLKAKVSSGTTGCSTGLHEYQLNLIVAMKLKDELLERGYRVAMIRETHEINISNAIRAEAANKLGADAFIRIHANSSTDSSIHGALTICQTPANPYNADLYEVCRKLSDCVLDGFVEATGANKKYVWETDTMSGINWCQVPVTILEMGFMSNPEEDQLMATEEYQDKMVLGIANGLDAFFEINSEE